MQIPILIEPVGANGFRAKCGEPLPIAVEAATREEAIAKLREQLTRLLQNGVQLTALEVPPEDNPWLAMAGMFDPSDPVVQDWEKAMAEYRRDVEADPDYL